MSRDATLIERKNRNITTPLTKYRVLVLRSLFCWKNIFEMKTKQENNIYEFIFLRR